MSATYRPRTNHQAKVFQFVDAYFAKNRAVPSCRELARAFHWASHNAAASLYRSMVGAGLLARIVQPDGQVMLVPAGRRVSNKRGKPSGCKVKRPQARKRKVKQNQQDTKP